MKAINKAFVWCGPVGFAVVLIGLLLARAFPPPSPLRSVGEVVAWYMDHTNQRRAGFFVMMIGGALVTPFVGMIIAHVRRIRGAGRAAADTQLLFGAILMVAVTLPPMFGLAAAYRPDVSPPMTSALNDVLWLIFVGWVPPFIAEVLFIAFAILADRSEEKVFPRWIGYGVLATVLLSFFGGFCVFVKEGPLAWNGFLAFWVAVFAFGWWMILMTVGMLRRINRDSEDEFVTDKPAQVRVPLPTE